MNMLMSLENKVGKIGDIYISKFTINRDSRIATSVWDMLEFQFTCVKGGVGVVDDVRVSLANALGHEAMGGRGCQGVSFKCTGS